MIPLAALLWVEHSTVIIVCPAGVNEASSRDDVYVLVIPSH